MIIHRLFTLLLTVVFACNISKISAQDEIIEHQGNKYIIHVEQLNPDSEMTLLDVLHICPEFFSTDGKDITTDYLLSVDDIMLGVDYKPLLEGIVPSTTRWMGIQAALIYSLKKAARDWTVNYPSAAVPMVTEKCMPTWLVRANMRPYAVLYKPV